MMLGDALKSASHSTYITQGLSISPKNEAVIHQAIGFAACAHRHQKRKYTGEPYFNHCVAVARLVAASGADVSVIIAAVLHDTIEDTDVTLADVIDHFGMQVAALVMEVTSPSSDLDGGRDARHHINLAHLRKASPDACNIKLADIIDNTSTIHERDALFAITYLNEKWDVMEALPHGNTALRERVRTQLNDNLIAAKRAVYPMPLGPYSYEDYLTPPSLYEGAIFATVRLAAGAFIIAWDGAHWQHANLTADKLMCRAVLSAEQLADAGIIMRYSAPASNNLGDPADSHP
jgi:guanosine-3',5'-bis(diphosphate) 3'-pyrophosphohydrolase